MRVHHLNCISTCPLGGKLMDDRAATFLERGELSCHCVLVETPDSLVLIDTGLGRLDVLDPRSRLSKVFLGLVRPEFREEMTAVRQIERLGFRPSDVRHIVLTHLDFDHAGGLDDFPHATVHLLAAEHDAAVARETMLDRMRYRPQQWSTRPGWHLYTPGDGESWYGFEAVRDLAGLPPEILLVPLRGHTYGHAGVAVRRNGDESGWLLCAGDAYFFHREMDPKDPWCTPGLRVYQWMMEKDRAARLRNQTRLRELRRAHRHEIEIFCSHDVREFERLSGRSTKIPADRLLLDPPSQGGTITRP